jgi:hypothetical protein
MKRMALAIGACVCLTVFSTVTMAQVGTATLNPPPDKPAVAEEGKANADTAYTYVDVASYTEDSPETIEAKAKDMEAEAKALEEQAATMRKRSKQGNVNSIWIIRPQFEQQAEALIVKWKNTPESDREGVQKELREVVKKEFQSRLSTYAAEIETLEGQVKEIRTKMDLRKNKQDEIIDFRVQQLLRDAQGLGWGTEPKKVMTSSGGNMTISGEGRSVFIGTPSANPPASSGTDSDPFAK